MKISDIIKRAFRNLGRNASRSRKTIIAISIGISSIITMFALSLGAKNISERSKAKGNELLKVEVLEYNYEGQDSILPSFEAGRIRWLNDEEIDYLINNFNDKTSFRYTHFLLNEKGDFRLAELNEYSIITNAVAINYDALKEAPLKFYKGGTVKDINGAIVSRSLIKHIMLTSEYEDYKSEKHYQDVDLLNKEIVYKIKVFKEENGRKKQVDEIKLPVRIDGVLEDDKQHFGSTGGIFDERDSNSLYDYSVIYIPRERIELLNKKYYLDYMKGSRVILYVNSIENMDSILRELKGKNFRVLSNYEDYKIIGYLNFIVKLVIGTLGFLILTTAIIGIINTMLMSVIERTYEIGMLKAIGIKIRNVKEIFILEASFMGLFGGAIGVFISFIAVTIMNLFMAGNKALMGGCSEKLKIAILPWYVILSGIIISILVSVAASMPAVYKATKIEVTEALKKK